MRLLQRIILPLTFCAVFACCTSSGDDQSQATDAAQKFATAFFNCDLDKAASLSLPESKPWISFVASNLTQADLDLLNNLEQQPEITVGDVRLTGDTLATATVSVSSYIAPAAIGKETQLGTDGTWQLTLIKKHGRWLFSKLNNL